MRGDNGCLILTRRVGQSIFIGDDVSVTIFSVRGNMVRIGVNAPKSLPVHREEIYNRIKDEEDRFKNYLIPGLSTMIGGEVSEEEKLAFIKNLSEENIWK